MVEIKKCEFVEVRHLASLASKAHVSVQATAGTQWFSVSKNDIIIGCGALMKKGGCIGRVKGIYIKDEYRGAGYGLKLTEALIQDGRDKLCTGIDLYTWHPEFWKKHGYRIIGKNAHGALRFYKGI